MSIHPTAIIDPSATIDPSVEIGPYAVIGPHSMIGAGCSIGAHAVIDRTHMGRNNRIFPGAYVGGAPQDLKFAGEETLLVMGDSNTVRECVTLNRGTQATQKTVIGSECLFMAYSHVAHDCVIGNHVIFANSATLAGHIEVGDYTVFGGLTAVHQHSRIGRLCMIGGGAMIPKDVPPFCIAQGDRATLKGLNLFGLRRAKFSHETVRKIKEAYRIVFMSGLSLEEALSRIEGSNPAPEVTEMAFFIRSSKRGVTRPASKAVQEEEVVS
jgi:UDP-N-acetylglucosamine acyltransferase